MRSNNLIVLILALAMGGVAAFLARSWVAAHTSTSVEEPVRTIVVAVTSLGFGSEITTDNVTEIPYAAATLPEGSFATVQDLIKDGRRVVLTPLGRNEPVLRSKVTAPGQRASLSSLLDGGKRAVTVPVDDVRGVAGFILPGDRVDVVLIRHDGAGGNQSYSDVIIQYVKVLAVDQIAGERQEKPTVAKAVTLEVTQEQAQKVLLATNVGKLSLVLRQPAEENLQASRRVTEHDLSMVEIAAAAPVPPTKPADFATVTVARGAKLEEYSVIRSTR
jgi:pilus assembly protein CpaB